MHSTQGDGRQVQHHKEMVARQGKLKTSPGHRIRIAGIHGSCLLAKDLKEGDRVFVGQREQTLVRVNHILEEKTSLVCITFYPDVPVEAFVIPDWGLQTFGELSQQLVLENPFASVSQEDLLRACPLQYED